MTVSLHNQDITQINPFELREYISLTSQDVFLWNHTIRENILYPNKLFNQEKYTKCLEYTQLNSFINDLPERDFTVLHDFGTQLSGGEKQRIALARALYSHYQLLLLDEPTSALDSVTSKKIFDALIMDTKENKKSMIYITHDISKAVLADKIAVINKGALVEYDTPTNLINNSQYFKELYNAVKN